MFINEMSQEQQKQLFLVCMYQLASNLNILLKVQDADDFHHRLVFLAGHVDYVSDLFPSSQPFYNRVFFIARCLYKGTMRSSSGHVEFVRNCLFAVNCYIAQSEVSNGVISG